MIFFLFTGRINIITSNRIKCFCNNSKYFNFVPHKNSGVWEGKLSSNIHWIDVQNCIVESSINNIYVIKSNIFLYACKCLSHFRYPKCYSYDNRYLLLISSDVEKNPGPVDCTQYTLQHPNLCPFYRVAIFMIYEKQVLVSKEESGTTSKRIITEGQGIQEFKEIFNGYFNSENIDFNTIGKRQNKLVSKIKDWGRKKPDEKNSFYSEFNPAVWFKLGESDKKKTQYRMSILSCS